ncbi:MAG: hypothetical protein JW768_05395 [Chitinispirillaceae bacterium]|nr:hypothetical protein [Chitinispirillaceae bacterium]
MRRSFSTFLAIALCAIITLPLLFGSCQQGPETITYIIDTLSIRDTLRIKDTVIRFDTLRDTAKIIIGEVPPLMLFGLVYDGLPGDTAYDYDSINAYLSISSKPPVRTATVNLGAHGLDYTEHQRMVSFFEGYNISNRIFPSLASVQYESFLRDTANALALSIRIPYFPSDTSTVPEHDTVSDTAAFPGLLDDDDLAFYDMHDARYDSVDYLKFLENAKSIKLDEDLKAVWKNVGAQWYGIECLLYVLYPETVIDILDTFSVDTQIVIPHSFFYQDSLTDPMKQYEILLVSVVPVNGPSPATWDSGASFDGKGYLFALHYYNAYAPLTASWENQQPAGLEKKTSRIQALRRPRSGEMLERLFGRNKP